MLMRTNRGVQVNENESVLFGRESLFPDKKRGLFAIGFVRAKAERTYSDAAKPALIENSEYLLITGYSLFCLLVCVPLEMQRNCADNLVVAPEFYADAALRTAGNRGYFCDVTAVGVAAARNHQDSIRCICNARKSIVCQTHQAHTLRPASMRGDFALCGNMEQRTAAADGDQISLGMIYGAAAYGIAVS